jgi:hypothetical protein
MTSTSFGIGEVVHILGLGEKDPQKHVTVTDVYHHDGDTRVVTVDGYGTRKTWTELDLRVACGRIPSDTPRRTNPTVAHVKAELARRGIAPPTPTAKPDVRTLTKDAIVDEVTRHPRKTDFAPPPEDW